MNTFNAQAYVNEEGKYILDKNIRVKSDNVELDGTSLPLGRDITANVTVGGISTGKEYKRNTSYADIINDMLSIDMYYHMNITFVSYNSKGEEYSYNNKYSLNSNKINITFPEVPDNDESGRKHTICFLTLNIDGEPDTVSTGYAISTGITNITTSDTYSTYTTLTIDEYEYIDGQSDISAYENSELISRIVYSIATDPIYYGCIPTSDNPNFDECSIYLIKNNSKLDINKYNLKIGNKITDGVDYFSANSYVNEIVNKVDNVTCEFTNSTTDLIIPFIAMPRDKTIEGIYDKDNGFKLSLDSHIVELHYPNKQSYDINGNPVYEYMKNSSLYYIYFGDPIIPGESTSYNIVSNKEDSISSGEPMDIYLNNKIFMSIDETKVSE